MPLWTALVMVLTMSVVALGCAPFSNSTGALQDVVPANGKLIAFADPPSIDVVFERIDGGEAVTLSHTTLGGESSLNSIALLIEPGDVSPGDVITVAARCRECESVDNITVIDDDVTAPVLAEGTPQLAATGSRDGQFGLFMRHYDVRLSMPEITDDNAVFARVRGEDIDVLLRGAPEMIFFAEGGVARTLCVTITVMDLAGNELALPDEACVELDPSTAEPWGQEPVIG